MTNVTMPQLGETVADGTVTKWFKRVGDSVTKGEVLFEVSTDKVDTEIPSPASGTLTAILVEEGTTVDVGVVLATIGSATEADVGGSAPTQPSTAPRPASMDSPSMSDVSASSRISPAVRRLLRENRLDEGSVPASGANGRLTRDDVLAYLAAASSVVESPTKGMSPIVRRLAEQNHVDVNAIEGTGPDGRISRSDVEAQLRRPGTGPSADDDLVIPFTKIRRLTAENMVRSKATSAHTLMVKEVDFERVEAQRRKHGAQFKEREGFGLTYLPFIALATIDALRAYPHINASVGNDELLVHRHLNLGIAVDLDGEGLVVPVIRNADSYDLASMARKIRELALAARTKKLTVDDLSAGTFTITNPGPFGTLLTGAVINQPQIAILATDGVTRKPVVVTSPSGEESIAIHSVGLLALTFDHRAIDGANAARFLSYIAGVLNERDMVHDA